MNCCLRWCVSAEALLHCASSLRRPSSAGVCYLGPPHGICLFSFHCVPATVGRVCYLGTLNSICLFSFNLQRSPLVIVDQKCYLGLLNGICLFSFFHCAPATVGRVCYLGSLNSICLFSFNLQRSPLVLVDRKCYLGLLNSIWFSLCVGRECYLGTLNSTCLFSFTCNDLRWS